MGATAATFAVLFDAVSSIGKFVEVFIYVYILLIVAYILTSWLRLPYSPTLNRIQRFLYDVCEPYLRLFRRMIPRSGRSTCRRWSESSCSSCFSRWSSRCSRG